MLKRILSAEALKSLVTVVESPMDTEIAAVCMLLSMYNTMCLYIGFRVHVLVNGYGKAEFLIRKAPILY